MRIAIAHIGQETCSFTPMRTTLATFRQFGLYEGADVLVKMQGVGPIGGFLAAAAEEAVDLTPLPIIQAWGGANGPLTAETLAFFEAKIVAGLEQIMPIDGFFFSQHGAAAAENEPDVEGHLLAAARRVLGPAIPIVSPLDHHGNITARMMNHLTALVAHRTQPHLPFETGKLAAHLLFAALRGDIKPVMAWRKLPMVTHQEQFLTNGGPMHEWFARARELETMPGVVSISPFPMQPWLDVPEGGWSVVVVTDGDLPLATRLSDELAELAWSRREAFMVYDSIPPAVAVHQAVAAPRGLVILSDTGDSVFGGAPGDSTHILCELLAQRVDQTLDQPVLLPIVDPEAVAAAFAGGTGNELTMPLGGKLETDFHTPVAVAARIAALGGGRIQAEVVGMESFDMGRAALLEIGALKIVVSEREGVGGNHPAVYHHFNLDPAQAKIIVLKTASNFQYYADVTSMIIRVDTPGPTMSHMEQFTWRRLPRPIWPLDIMPASGRFQE